MDKLEIEMPLVNKCSKENCAYNNGCGCHAMAITVGDGSNPGCDTYFDSAKHTQEKQRIAGVGACKVSVCKHNTDFECQADSISVGEKDGGVKCLTFERR